MTRKQRNGSTPRQPWTPFAAAAPTPGSMARIRAAGLPAALDDNERMVMNNRYTVIIAEWETPVPVTHLSIRRNDRKTMRDWRDLQRIKNELCGYECEAVELFPAESRLVDTANQFHLWCLPRGARFPFGFDFRSVLDHDEAPFVTGAVQRPFDQ
jgi:hypothetical protein